MNTRKPMIGEIVLFTPNPDDTVAKSNHNHEPIPAIVTRVWSEVCVNLKIVPDNGPMQDRSSVTHQSANPAGYHFEFQDEHYDPSLKLQHLEKPEETDGAYAYGSLGKFVEGGRMRRISKDHTIPVEDILSEAQGMIEKIGSHVLLTDATIAITNARHSIADYLEGADKQ